MSWSEKFKYYRDDEIEQLSGLRRQAGFLGISPHEFYSMDLREFLDFKFGTMSFRESEYNNMQSLLHTISGKIAQAVWGNKEFRKALKNVNWTDGIIPENKKKKRAKGLQATLDRIEKQYGIKLTEIKEEGNNG